MEQYSPRMAVAVRRELRLADGAYFAQLLAHYQQRGGPGLVLAEREQAARQQRQQVNYPAQAA